MSTVLVTGATGSVGAALVPLLADRGVTVRAAARDPRRVAPAPGVVPVAFDLTDHATFDAALAGVDAVFLMRPPHISDARVVRPFVDACALAGVRRVVFLSVQGAGANPFVPHHAIERDVRRSGAAWTFLRPSFFMSNLVTTHLPDLLEGRIVIPAGRGRTNFIDVADIAEAAAVVLTTPGHERRAYELTGPEALTYTQVASVLSGVLGREIVYTAPSDARFREHMRAAGHDEAFVGVMSSIYALARFGMAAGTTRELDALLGRPGATLEEWALRELPAIASCPRP